MHAKDPLETIYDDHADAVYGFLCHLLRHESEVRDVMQDLFCRIAQRPEILSQVQQERSYLIRMAHRMGIDSIRRRHARSRAHNALGDVSESFDQPSHSLDAPSIDMELAKAIASLPSEQSTVIHLKLKEEMTFDQIAETLDIPANTAASRYRYGLEKLRSLLKPLYEEIK